MIVIYLPPNIRIGKPLIIRLCFDFNCGWEKGNKHTRITKLPGVQLKLLILSKFQIWIWLLSKVLTWYEIKMDDKYQYTWKNNIGLKSFPYKCVALVSLNYQLINLLYCSYWFRLLRTLKYVLDPYKLYFE